MHEYEKKVENNCANVELNKLIKFIKLIINYLTNLFYIFNLKLLHHEKFKTCHSGSNIPGRGCL